MKGPGQKANYKSGRGFMNFLLLTCRFGQEIDIPLPEMVFPESNLRLEHESGAVLEFLSLDALKQVNSAEDPLKVAVAEEWAKQR